MSSGTETLVGRHPEMPLAGPAVEGRPQRFRRGEAIGGTHGPVEVTPARTTVTRRGEIQVPERGNDRRILVGKCSTDRPARRNSTTISNRGAFTRPAYFRWNRATLDPGVRLIVDLRRRSTRLSDARLWLVLPVRQPLHHWFCDHDCGRRRGNDHRRFRHDHPVAAGVETKRTVC